MIYRCDDITEALASYALDALPPAERAGVVEHLAECRLHDEELAGFRAAAARLSLAVAGSSPPAGLRAALLEAFDREKSAPRAAEAPPLPEEPPALPAPSPAYPSGGILAIFRQPALAYGIAAALLVAVLGLAAWNVSMRESGDDVVRMATFESGMSLEVEYMKEQHVAVLNIDMPPPAAGMVYQAWMISEGNPVSLGLIDGSRGRMAFAADMEEGSSIAVSLEPAGGSEAPSEVKITAEF